jgi:transglutaminase-like putative cysteine protease
MWWLAGTWLMQIRAGFKIAYDCPRPTPMLLMLSVHPSRTADLVTPHKLLYEPNVEARDYRDTFGNVVTRLVAPTGRITISTDFIVSDPGTPDILEPDAEQLPVEALPDDVMVYLLGSRYCDTDKLMHTAWSLFANAPQGWGRVQAICDYVNDHLTFGYQHASATRTALDGYNERRGVCRDYAHLAITLCRCMKIPARYCTGYLGDIGIPPAPEPMDFSAWFEAYLSGRWYTFDARHNTPRIGRVLMARGRDATDVALSTIFGPATLTRFTVVTEEATSA